MLELIVNVIEQGLIYGIIALGVYITYKILDFPDMTVDGTIILGAAISSILIVNGVNPFIAIILAFLGGALAGLATGILHVYLKISSLLSGILVMTGLYSINLRVMKTSNISIPNKVTVFSLLGTLIVIVLFIFFIKLLIDLFLKTKLGMLLIITGDNENLVTSLGQNIGTMKIMGLMLANGIVAIGGALLTQYMGFADMSLGTGTLVIGLASIIIGQTIFKLPFIKETTMVVFGAILYNVLQSITLNLGFPASDFKLISALTVITAFIISSNKKVLKLKRGEKNVRN
ncbi:MAG: transporter permease [Haloplasmataceae bacterium]|jgi:putative ABC transport system permease protein|nr:transporter permease [Haloplasmataceae bacterium]